MAYKTITVGSAIGTLPTYTRSNYTFDAYYDAPTGGSVVTASTTITTSSTVSILYGSVGFGIYPRFTLNNTAIFYLDLNGGSRNSAPDGPWTWDGTNSRYYRSIYIGGSAGLEAHCLHQTLQLIILNGLGIHLVVLNEHQVMQLMNYHKTLIMQYTLTRDTFYLDAQGGTGSTSNGWTWNSTNSNIIKSISFKVLLWVHLPSSNT